MTFPWEKPVQAPLPVWDCKCRQPGLGGDCDGSCRNPPPGFRSLYDPPDWIDDAQPELGRVQSDPLGIPDFLRRDKDNRAPFMYVNR